uniref:Xrn1 N-terminal domain-containing protein n=1 Tax=viral metagenome TaxID=1070528 RepID=A0A6C0CI16_9ZZZZ
MGVKKYQQWVRQRFRDYHSHELGRLLVTKRGSRKVRRLFLDLNAIIHTAVNIVYDGIVDDFDSYWGDVVIELTAEIIAIMEIVNPVYLMYLGADGTVSKAKMLQQRQRSYRVMPKEDQFSRNNVKPGTEFMATLSHSLRESLKAALNKRKKDGDFTPAAVEFSDASIPGEGEHKILARMKSATKEGDSQKMVDVIFSPDSDLHFLLMLNVPAGDHAIIMRQVHKVEEEESKYEYFYVTEIRSKMDLGIHTPMGFSKISSRNDFALISCFAGNDFLPALPFFKYGDGDVFDAILSAHSAAFKAFQSSDYVYDNWENLLKYLITLSEKEEGFLLKTSNAMTSQSSEFYDGENDRRSGAIELATGSGNKGEPKFETSFFDSKYNRQITGTYHHVNQLQIEELDYDYIDEMCHAYLEGLVWVVQYYRTQGKGVNLNWAYTYHYAPNLTDLISYLKRHEVPAWKRTPLLTSVIEVPFTPVEQLLAILRPEDLHLVPNIARTLFLNKMPSLYPEKVLFDYTLIPFGREHDAIVLINFPDMLSIRALFQAIEDDPSVKARNKTHNIVKIWKK